MRDWLYPGARVVCVDASHGYLSPNNGGLVEGAVYVIEAVTSDFSETAVRVPGMPEGDWVRASRFRPLRKRTTDISIFRQLLTPSKQKESA